MSFVCGICGEKHDGLPDWAYGRPDHWLGITDEERAAGRASDDLCRIPGGAFYVRCFLMIPLIDGPRGNLGMGVWGSLSETNFRRYVETFDDDDQSKLGPMFSYLSNEVAVFPDSLNLKADMVPQDNKQRPQLRLWECDHPLFLAQQKGISLEQAWAFVHEAQISIPTPDRPTA